MHAHAHSKHHRLVLSVLLIDIVLGFSRSRRPVQRHFGAGAGRGGASRQPGHVLVGGGQARDWPVPGPDEGVCGVPEEAGGSAEDQR